MEIKMTRFQSEAALEQGVNVDDLQDYWTGFRCLGPDLFRIAKYDGSRTEEIQRGWMPRGTESTADLKELVSQKAILNKEQTENFVHAEEAIVKDCDFYEHINKETNIYCLYARCSDGLISVGWRMKSGDLIKAKNLAAFTLYIYGICGMLSAGSDPKLWEFVYYHLPFAFGLDRKICDKYFVKYLKQLVC